MLQSDVLGLPARAAVPLETDKHRHAKVGLSLSGHAVEMARAMFKGDYECIEALVERGALPRAYRDSLLSDENVYTVH